MEAGCSGKCRTGEDVVAASTSQKLPKIDDESALQQQSPLFLLSPEQGNRQLTESSILKVVPPLSTSSFEESGRARLRTCFEEHYVGDVNALSKEVDNAYKTFLNPEEKICSACAPLLQSSGTGKSRATFELAKSRYVVYVSLREERSTGYPQRSPRLLVNHLKMRDRTWNQFFGATTAVVGALIENVTKPPEWETNPRPDWRTYFDEHVAEQAMKAVRGDSNIVSPNSKTYFPSKGLFQLLALRRCSKGGDEFHEEYDFATNFWRTVIRCEEAMVPEHKWRWNDCLPGTDLPHPLIFVFDEARALLPKGGEEPKSSPLIRMRDAIGPEHYGVRFGIFALLLDTSATVANVTLQAEDDPSSRNRRELLRLLPPFIHPIPSDCFVSNLPRTLSDVCNKDFLLLQGRPMWEKSAIARSRKNRFDTTAEVAAAKLGFDSCNGLVSASQVNDELAVALLGPRVQINTRMSYRLANKMIDRLWCFLGINDKRTFLKGQYLSEPVMVAACFETMSRKMSVTLKALEVLAAELVPNHTEIGQQGEFVARFVLVHAWDSLIRSSKLELFQPNSVESFLNVLVGSENVEAVKKSQLPWVTRLLTSQMLFTHFAPCDVSLNEDNLLLLDLLRRGAGGYFLDQDHWFVDLVIPFLVGTTDTSIAEENVSCILVQVKNWATPKGKNWEQKRLDKCKDALKSAATLKAENPKQKPLPQVVISSRVQYRTEELPIVSLLFLVNHPKPEIVVTANEFSLDIVIRDIKSIPILDDCLLNALDPFCNRDDFDVSDLAVASSIRKSRKSPLANDSNFAYAD